MADTKKYVTEFEYKTNAEEAMKQLQKVYVESTKIANVVNDFNKALKKSPQLAEKFYGIMSAIPKTMKRLSELSKIELIPRKELDRITSTIGKVSDSMQLMSSTSILDPKELKESEDILSKALLSLEELESTNAKVIKQATKYNTLVSSVSKMLKVTGDNTERFKNSSSDVYNYWTKTRRELKGLERSLEEIKDTGKLSTTAMQEFDKKLMDAKKHVSELESKQKESAERIQEASDKIVDLLKGAEKFATVTGKVSFGSVVVELEQMSKEIEAVREAGRYTDDEMKKFEERTATIGNKLGKAKEVFTSIETVLSTSTDVAKEMSNATAKISYEESVKDVRSLRSELEAILKSPQPDLDRFNDSIDGVRKRFENALEKMNLMVSADEQLASKTKLASEAMNLVRRMLNDIQEDMNDIQNVELAKRFQQSENVIEQMRNEIIRMLGDQNVSNKMVREKIGLLKNEGDKLREIVNQQLELKKLDEQSISATVRRAREQDKVNQAYIKQILSTRKNVGGLYDAMKVIKQGIPTKAMATFGETGVVAGKAIMGVFKGLGSIFAPLFAFTSIVSAVKMMLDLERQVKAARKQMFMMAADTNVAGGAMQTLASGGQLASTVIEDMAKGLDNMRLIGMGINMDQAIEGMKEFQKQGFRVSAIYNEITDQQGGLFGTAASLGMEIGELASRAGSLRTEFGYSLGETGKAFEQLRKDAKTAGMTVSMFFDRVMNASVGLALWGQKIDLVSDVFSNLVKNMKLPEAVGAKLAENMVKGFSGLSTEMQITTYELGKGRKQWNKYAASQKQAIEQRVNNIDQEIAAAESEAKAAEYSGDASDAAKAAAKYELANSLRSEKASKLREKRTIDELDSLKGLSGELARARKMDVGNQIMMQLQAAGGQIGLDFSGDIEKLDTDFARSFFEMEKLGETFGIDRDTMKGYQEIVQTLSDNVKGFKSTAQKMGIDDIKGLIGALADPQKSSASVQNQLLKLTQKGNKVDLKNFARQLAGQDEFLQYQKELLSAADSSDPASVLAPLLLKIDTGLNLSARQTKDAMDKADAAAAKRAGTAMLSQTKSTEDAINNTITKILRDGFRFLEKLVNMFAFVNNKNLQGFNTLSDRLSENQKVAEQNLDALKSQKSTLGVEIARLEQEPVPKNEQEKNAREAQISALKQQQKSVDDAIKSFEDLSSASSNAASILGQEGKITKKVQEATISADEKARIAAQKAQIVEQGKQQISTQGEYGKQISENLESMKGDYKGTQFGSKGNLALEVAGGVTGGLVGSIFGPAGTVAGTALGVGGAAQFRTPTVKPGSETIKMGEEPLVGEPRAVKLDKQGKVVQPEFQLGSAKQVSEAFANQPSQPTEIKENKFQPQPTEIEAKNIKTQSKKVEIGTKGKPPQVNKANFDIKNSLMNANINQIDSKSTIGTFPKSTMSVKDSQITMEQLNVPEQELKNLMSDEQKAAYEKLKPDQKAAFSQIKWTSDEGVMKKQISDAFKQAKVPGFDKGGVIPGSDLKGDKVLSALNSGELVVPEKTWQNAFNTLSTANAGQKSLQSVIDSMKIDSGTTTNVGPTENKTINDNRVFNISVDSTKNAEYVKQVVLNAIYMDKK